MTVEQLRYLLETGQVVSGKSLIEHNEVLGLEKALQYIKLLVKTDYIGLEQILGIHRRVMGHVDPIASGVFRDEKVKSFYSFEMYYFDNTCRLTCTIFQLLTTYKLFQLCTFCLGFCRKPRSSSP